MKYKHPCILHDSKKYREWWDSVFWEKEYSNYQKSDNRRPFSLTGEFQIIEPLVKRAAREHIKLLKKIEKIYE